MHTVEFILIPKRMFITKQPVRSDILENPFIETKLLSYLICSETHRQLKKNVEKADRVVQTEATENKQEEPEKIDSISDDSEMEPKHHKKPKTTFESIMAKVKLKETQSQTCSDSARYYPPIRYSYYWWKK